MQRAKYRSDLKNGNRARSCATCAPGIRKYPSRLGLELVDELDEVVWRCFIEMLCFEIRELMRRLYIVGGDLSPLHDILHEKIPEGDVLRPEAEGAVSRYVQRRCEQVLSCDVADLPKRLFDLGAAVHALEY